MLTSPEILATGTLFGVLALTVGWWVGCVEWRMRAWLAIRDTLYTFAAVLTVIIPYIRRFSPSPFGLLPIYNRAHCQIDLLNFLVPTETNLVGHLGAVRELQANFSAGTEAVGYMGLLPFLTRCAALAPSKRPDSKTAAERILALLLVMICILALGPLVRVDGRPIAPGPWLLAVSVPILNNALPARFTLYAFSVLSVLAAMWLADQDRRSSLRWMMAGLMLLSVLLSLAPAGERITCILRPRSLSSLFQRERYGSDAPIRFKRFWNAVPGGKRLLRQMAGAISE